MTEHWQWHVLFGLLTLAASASIWATFFLGRLNDRRAERDVAERAEAAERRSSSPRVAEAERDGSDAAAAERANGG